MRKDKQPDNEESLLRKIKSLSDIESATSVPDVPDSKDLSELKRFVKSNNPEQIKEEFLKKFKESDQEQKNEMMRIISANQKINPTNRSFSSIHEKKRRYIIEDLCSKMDKLQDKKRSESGYYSDFPDLPVPTNSPEVND